MVKIVADRGIPGVSEALSPFGEVHLMAPDAMRPANLAKTDILIVRSVAKVGNEMLFGTGIRMVGSATAGTDHVDKAYLKAQNITFAHAPGANADSVADHVITALLMLAARTGEALRGKTLGVVGYGQVGSRVTQRALGLGLATMVCDPPLEASSRDLSMDFRSLDDLLRGSDILTLHTPLVEGGPHGTRHLVAGDRLEGFRGWLINTSRGGVVDNTALRHCIEAGRGPAATVFDVWEGEPWPDPALVSQVDIATPHVAGYAADSKWEATRQMALAVGRFLGVENGGCQEAEPPALPVLSIRAPAYSGSDSAETDLRWLADLAQAMCPLGLDHNALAHILSAPDPGSAFEGYRAQYPGRRLMRCHRVSGVPERLRVAVSVALACRCAGTPEDANDHRVEG